MNVKIGVLGGIGPEATSEFYKRLVLELQKRRMIKSNKDFPQILINSIPAEELVSNKISKKKLSFYIKGLKELDSFNVDFIVIVCNTIYQFYKYIQNEIKTPIINLKNEVEKEIHKEGIKTLLVLGTPSTMKNKLYKFKGVKTLYPTQNEVQKISNAILRFNVGNKKNTQNKIFKDILKRHNNQNATILLGCTEISLMVRNKHYNIIDTMDILVEATINKLRNLSISS